MYKKLLVANWKENPATESGALKLFTATALVQQACLRGISAKRGKNVEVVVCPPVVYLEGIAQKFKALRSRAGLSLGAQDVFWEEQGSYTSEVGSFMLKSFGVRYVIIGHSERRKLLHETDAMVNKKVLAALRAGLTVILCVGEPLLVREKGTRVAERFVKNQLKKDLKGIKKVFGSVGPRRREDDRVKESSLIVAYEPLWAIGTGKNDSPQDASAMANFIKNLLDSEFWILNSRLLYGGSVNGQNITGYVHSKGIDGALVGGASLMAGEMQKIIQRSGS